MTDRGTVEKLSIYKVSLECPCDKSWYNACCSQHRSFIVNFNWINYTRPGVSSLSETWINKFYYQRIFNEKSTLRQENIKFIHDIYENLLGSEQFISGFQDCHLKQWISARGVIWRDSWYMKRKNLQKGMNDVNMLIMVDMQFIPFLWSWIK